MTDLSPIFGSQVPELPQNHDVVNKKLDVVNGIKTSEGQII
jgi:hypothetical protein